MGPRASDVFLFGARVIETDVKNAERSEEHHRPNRFFGVHVNLGGAIKAHIGMLSWCDAVFFWLDLSPMPMELRISGGVTT